MLLTYSNLINELEGSVKRYSPMDLPSNVAYEVRIFYSVHVVELCERNDIPFDFLGSEKKIKCVYV